MGHFSLCGALFAAYQSSNGDLRGQYMLCALFKAHMLLALPQKSSNFSVVAIISTSDIQIVDADNGRGKHAAHSRLYRLPTHKGQDFSVTAPRFRGK